MWGYDYSSLSRIFNGIVDWMDRTHSFRLQRVVDALDHQGANFNAKLIAKFNVLHPGAPHPPELERMVMSVDGTKIRVAHPDGADWRQYAVFSGDKWFHSTSAQGCWGPDGICYHWWDQAVARHNDQYFMNESGLNGIFERAQQHLRPYEWYWIYCDKGYAKDTCLW